MGLIYGVLQPLSAASAVLFPFHIYPLSVALAPRNSHYVGSLRRANFAYDLCVERIGEEERSLLDLTSWKVALMVLSGAA